MARLERIIERLDLKEFQLRALLDVTKAVSYTHLTLPTSDLV